VRRQLTQTPGPKAWGLFVDLLREWFRKHRHAAVPTKARVGNFDFGQMAIRRRREHRAGVLSPEQIRFCESFRGWTWDPIDSRFMLRVEALRAFHRRHGHLRIPKGYLADGVDLEGWLSERRLAYRKGVIDPARARLLESLPAFSWAPVEARHEQALQRLREFVRREGHALVPQKHVERGYPLGIWVHGARARNKERRVPLDLVRRLERVRGWTWHPKRDDWSRFLRFLRSFVRQKRHARVPYHYRRGQYPLGVRVWSVRTSRRLGQLSAEKVRTLSRVRGWVWNVKEMAFEENVRLVRDCLRRAGTADLSHAFRDPRTGYRIGRRVLWLRAAYGQGRLTKAKIMALERIPGWTWKTKRVAARPE
jgi:hypothetical protein